MDSRRAAYTPQKTIVQRNSNLPDITELERTDSRGSTNFSYPLTARPNSPPPKSTALMQSRWAPVPLQNGLSPQEAEVTRQSVYDSAQQPVKKKKKRVARGAAEGSHLSSSTMGFRTSVAQDTPSPPRVEPVSKADESQQTPPVKKKKKIITSPQDSDVHARPMSPGYSSDSDSSPEKVMKRAQRASGTLNKQPSVVREDWEGEQGNDVQGAPTAPLRVTTSSTAENLAVPVKSTQSSTTANTSRKVDEVSTEINPIAQYAPVLAVDVPTPPLHMPASSARKPTGNGYLDVGESVSQGPRQTSLSPSRSKTRFSKTLSSDLSTERKHEPLPRSVSPGKSALKHHSPPQPESPTDSAVPGAWQRTSTTPSEASDNNSMASEQGLMSVPKKKKSARVSFGEDAEIVGVSQTSPTDSPILASPQHKDASKKGWFGLGKSKSPLGAIPAEDDMEEVMKPRPVLPSFGSVRGKIRSGDAPEQRVSSATLHDSVTVPGSSGGYNNNNTLMPSTSEASSTSFVPTGTSASSDHAIGSILAQEAQNRLPNGIYNKALQQPLPPEVTSVEGTGYVSDTNESIYSQDEEPQHLEQEQPQVTNASVTETTNAGESVPTIAVQPATPAMEQAERDDMFVSLPGGFPVSAETLHANSQGQSTQGQSTQGQSTQEQPSQASPTGLRIAEALPQGQVTSQQLASPTGKSLSDALHDRDQEESEAESTAGDSIYSDAEEDLSYMGSDGFGSINAIVESPIITSPVHRMTAPLESPTPKSVSSGTAKPPTSRTESWEQTQAHWTEVAQRRRQDTEQPPASILRSEPSQAPNIGIRSEPSQPPKPKEKKKKVNMDISAGEIAPAVPATINSLQVPTQQPGPYPTLGSGRGVPADRGAAPARTSMKTQARAKPEVEEFPRFRRSMRSGPSSAVASDSQMPTSQPTSKSKSASQKHIPSTADGLAAADIVDARASEKQRTAKATKPQKATPIPAPWVRGSRASKAAPLPGMFTNDSDSSSSFKKRRKGTAAPDGKYTMRRSMRGGQSAEARQPIQSPPVQPGGRGGIRSLSPANRRPFSSAGGQGTMRTSMRTSFDGSPQTIKKQESHQRSLSSSFAGFGKSKPNAPGATVARASASKIKSRFADSDDEDVAIPRPFNSRFEDSSDEEPAPVKFRPVRGIPRKIDEGDSTDLEDSSDVEKEMEKSKAAAQPTLPANTPAENGTVNGSDAPQSPAKEKKSFFGRFRSKKGREKNPRISKAALESSAQTQAYLDQARTEMERAKSPEMENARNPELGATKSTESSAAKSPSSAASGGPRRLIPRRIMSDQYTPQRIPDESWPLPPKIGAVDDNRPFSADGVASVSSPAIEDTADAPQRQNTTFSAKTAGGTPVYSEKTGKKKKFPMLRKAFGLYD